MFGLLKITINRWLLVLIKVNHIYFLLFGEENPFTIDVNLNDPDEEPLSKYSLSETFFMPLPVGHADWPGDCIATFHINKDIKRGVSNVCFADGHVSDEDGTVPGTSYELTGRYIDRLTR